MDKALVRVIQEVITVIAVGALNEYLRDKDTGETTPASPDDSLERFYNFEE